MNKTKTNKTMQEAPKPTKFQNINTQHLYPRNIRKGDVFEVWMYNKWHIVEAREDSTTPLADEPEYYVVYFIINEMPFRSHYVVENQRWEA